jgi:UPF0716 protein FxsA
MAALVLFCLFIGLPVAEILTFIEVGGRIGGLPTITATVVTAAIGAGLFRFQGMNTLARAQASLQGGKMPLEEVIGSLGLIAAAVCLFVPGFITDIFGFLLFMPPLRLVILGGMLRSVLARAQARMSTSGFGPGHGMGPTNVDGDTIDGEFKDVSELEVAAPVLEVKSEEGLAQRSWDKQ